MTPPPLTDAELVFQTGCKSIDANLDDFLSTQIKLGEFPRPDWITWPEHYAVSNAGVRSRTVTRISIDTNFPWIVAATNENLASINRTEFLKHPSPFFVENGTFSNDFVAWILNGSSIPVSGPDVKGYRDPALVLQNSIREVAPVGRFDDCESALGLKSGTNIASKIGDGQFEGKHLVEILWVRVDIWGCDQFGMGHAPWKSNGLGQMCAKSDFRG